MFSFLSRFIESIFDSCLVTLRLAFESVMESNIYRIERIYKIKRISFLPENLFKSKFICDPIGNNPCCVTFITESYSIFFSSLHNREVYLHPKIQLESFVSFDQLLANTINRLISLVLIYRCSDISNISTLEKRG